MKWPTQDEINKAMEDCAFQIPYDGTNDFYNEDKITGFREAIKFIKSKYEPGCGDAVKPSNEPRGFSNNFNDAPNPYESPSPAYGTVVNHAIAIAHGDIDRLEAEVNKLVAHLVELVNDYESWEADLISDNRCWGPEGMNSNPTLTNELYNEMLELQQKRNKAKEALKPYVK